MGEWSTRTLAEAGVVLLDCVHKTPPATDGGLPYVAIPEMKSGRLDLDAARRISHDHFVEWTRKAAPQSHDIVLSRRCNPGETAYVPPTNTEFALGQNLVLLRADGSCVYPPFLRWLARSPAWWEQIRIFLNVGAVFDSLKCGDIPNFELPIPPLDDQRCIAHILGTLDDKVELNRRMNETLEATARAIFKSWFVDFAPVRAKMDGRQPPGMDADTAALFPDSFEESELGEIPAGWQVGSVDDVAIINARTLGRHDSLETIDYIEISEVMRGEVNGITRYERGQEPSRARRRLQHGDTVLSTVRPDRGAYFLTLEPPETLIASTGFAVLTPKTGHWAFLHTLMTQQEMGDELGRLADGGAYPAVRPEVVGNLPVIVPDDANLIDTYESLTQPLFRRAAMNRRASRILAAIRDTLLPKLISAELRVPQMEGVK